MFFTILFYVLVLSQLLLISFYLPKKLVSRMRYVINKFPIDEYPKLYTKDLEYYYSRLGVFRIFNFIILSAGIIILLFILEWQLRTGSDVPDSFPIVYGLIQFVPFVILEISEFRKFKKMRKVDDRTSRKADLTKRKFLDFISPKLVISAIAATLFYVFVELYIPNFEYSLDNKGIIRLVTILVCDLFLAAIVILNLRGKKMDPFQSHKDRMKMIKFAVKSSVLTSIVAALFFSGLILIEVYELESLKIILNGLYFQVIALIGVGSLIKNYPIEDIDFEGYKIVKT